MGWMAADESTTQRRRVTLHLSDAARFVVSRAVPWVRSTPGTHLWLLILAVNSGILAVVSPELREFLLHHNSTNLVELRAHPVRVLIVSALWIESPSGFALYFLFYEVIHAPAERWLGTGRWLAVVATAHVGATLISQRAVLMGISYNRLPRSLAYTVDIGVSYGLVGIVGVLTYYLPRRPRPLRWLYAATAIGFFGYPLLGSGRTFTDLGHFSSLLIGFTCYALTPPGRVLRAPRRLRPRRWRP
jgi:hypothetical protein